MKTIVLVSWLAFFCLAAASAQSLPDITEATYTVVPPRQGSPNNAVTVRVAVPTPVGAHTAQVTVTAGADTIHTQAYPVSTVASQTLGGGTVMVLRFYTALPPTGATVSVRLSDASGNPGPAFTALAQ